MGAKGPVCPYKAAIPQTNPKRVAPWAMGRRGLVGVSVFIGLTLGSPVPSLVEDVTIQVFSGNWPEGWVFLGQKARVKIFSGYALE